MNPHCANAKPLSILFLLSTLSLFQLDVIVSSPDEQSIMMYVSQFLEHFPDMEQVRILVSHC